VRRPGPTLVASAALLASGGGCGDEELAPASGPPPFGERFGAAELLAEIEDTGAIDDDPTVTDDGLVLVWNSDRDEHGGAPHLFLSTREDPAARFGPPSRLDGLATTAGETTPELCPDGTCLHFATVFDGGVGSYDIVRSARAGDGELLAPTLIEGINSPQKDDGPAFARSGLEVIFASDRDGTQRLFRATRPRVDDAWGAPLPVQGLEPTDFQGGPALSADGRVLYFHATTSGEPTQLHIYRAFRAEEDARFGAGELVEELASEGNDLDPHLAADGRSLYFASDRDGSYALYVARR
jgi:hypothetical protein